MAEEISPLEDHGWWMERLRKDAKATRPEALRLAEFCDGNVLYHPAAAELRRMHDHNQMLEHAYESACKIISEQDKKLKELEAVNAELLAALNNIETSTHDAMTAALARVAIAKAEEQK